MTRDQFLAEQIGLKGWYCSVCQRELLPKEVTHEEDCAICGCHLVDPDFTQPADAYALQQWVMAQEWWGDFFFKEYDKHYVSMPRFNAATFTEWIFSSPDRFADLVAEYRGWKDD